jgi:chromosome partitioning protein
MSGNKSPKTIATINFKGGVGKTTVTWCLADTLSTYSDATVLMFDLDAQMSLTQAVGLNEDSGSLYPAFAGWYDKSVTGRRTIFDAIDQYTKLAAAHFDFPVAYDFIIISWTKQGYGFVQPDRPIPGNRAGPLCWISLATASGHQ